MGCNFRVTIRLVSLYTLSRDKATPGYNNATKKAPATSFVHTVGQVKARKPTGTLQLKVIVPPTMLQEAEDRSCWPLPGFAVAWTLCQSEYAMSCMYLSTYCTVSEPFCKFIRCVREGFSARKKASRRVAVK